MVTLNTTRGIFKSKKGDLTGVIYLVITVAALAVVLLLGSYIGKTVSGGLKNAVNSTNDNVNQAFDSTINVSKTGFNAVWYIVFGGLLIGLMITAWYMPTHPIFVVPFIILLIVAIMVGMAMSNAYSALAENATLASTASEQTPIAFFMNKLPFVAFIVGLIALIITFAKPGGENGTPTM